MPLNPKFESQIKFRYTIIKGERMINFKLDYCPKCGRKNYLMFSNNPLSGTTICFDCIAQQLNYQNIEHAEFFCRTYNLP